MVNPDSNDNAPDREEDSDEEMLEAALGSIPADSQEYCDEYSQEDSPKEEEGEEEEQHVSQRDGEGGDELASEYLLNNYDEVCLIRNGVKTDLTLRSSYTKLRHFPMWIPTDPADYDKRFDCEGYIICRYPEPKPAD